MASRLFPNILLFFLTLFMSLFLTVGTTFAQSAGETLNPCPPGSDSPLCGTADLGFGDVIGDLIQFIFVIAVVLALGFLVFGGIKWITSGGDKANVESARGTIIAAIIGLIVVFLAYVILNLVLVFLTGEGIGGVEIPNLSNLGSSGGTNLNNCPSLGESDCIRSNACSWNPTGRFCAEN